LREGVMAQDLLAQGGMVAKAVVNLDGGLLAVDYSKIDVCPRLLRH